MDPSSSNFLHSYHKEPSLTDLDCGCPHLYHATKNFVTTLCILATVFVLPLLCLPCVYVWIVRGATQDAIEAARSGGADGRDFWQEGGIHGTEGVLSRWTVNEVLNQMEQIYRNDKTQTFYTLAMTGKTNTNTIDTVMVTTTDNSTVLSSSSSMLQSLPQEDPDPVRQIQPFPPQKYGNINRHKKYSNPMHCVPIQKRISVELPNECCICMTEFSFTRIPPTSSSLSLSSSSSSSSTNSLPEKEKEQIDNRAIVRTKCRHVFHRDCLGGWLRGGWDIEHADTDTNTNNNNARAARRVCPLCREELVPESPPPSPPSSP